MGKLEKMLGSVGNLWEERVREMTTVTRGSRHDTARSAEVQVMAGPNWGTAEERDSGVAVTLDREVGTRAYLDIKGACLCSRMQFQRPRELR